MAPKSDKRPAGGDKESEVWSAIAAFEQILEAIPNDRTSIETLAHAYGQIGDLARAKDYTTRLANLVLVESDRVAAQELIPRLEPYARDDAGTAELLKKLMDLVLSAGDTEHPKAPDDKKGVSDPDRKITMDQPVSAGKVRTTFSITTELPLAWNLLKSNEITQEEYSAVIQDLTEMSATDASVTVSVLHVLHDRAFKNLPKIMASLAKECGTPIISLANFELQPNAFSLLPVELMIRRGVVVFDLFGSDALTVITNPLDKELMKDVGSITGRKHFFYLTQPTEFDAAIVKISAWFELQKAVGSQP